MSLALQVSRSMSQCRIICSTDPTRKMPNSKAFKGSIHCVTVLCACSWCSVHSTASFDSPCLTCVKCSNFAAHVGRAGVTPFLAAHLRGYDNFKWMLYGDDDTVFFVDNALDMLEELDHNMPYFLTDHLWFPDQFGESHLAVHNSHSCICTHHIATQRICC